jgi:DNA topoisomerase IB
MLDELDRLIGTLPAPTQGAVRRPRTKPGVRLDGVDPKLIDFASRNDLTVTSGREGRHNRGSAHGSGAALDFRTRDKSPEEVERVFSAARLEGLGVGDERVRPQGQKVWGGPHGHLSVHGGQSTQDPLDNIISSLPSTQTDPLDSLISTLPATTQPVNAETATRSSSTAPQPPPPTFEPQVTPPTGLEAKAQVEELHRPQAPVRAGTVRSLAGTTQRPMRPRAQTTQALYAENSPEMRALLHKASQGDLQAAQQIADVRGWRASAAQGDIKAAQRLQDLRYGGRPITARPLSEDPFVAQNSEYGAAKMREGVQAARPHEPSRFFSDHVGQSDGQYRDTDAQREELTRTAEALADAEARRGQGDTLSTQESEFWRSKGFDHAPRTAQEVNANKTLSRSTKDYLLSLAEQDAEGNLKFNTPNLPNYQTFAYQGLEEENRRAGQDEIARSLTPEDRQEVSQRAKALAEKNTVIRSAVAPLLNTVAAGGEDMLGGVYKVAEDIVNSTELLGQDHTISDYFKKRAYMTRAVVDEADKANPMSKTERAFAFGSNLLGDVALLTAASELGGTRAAFAGTGFFGSLGRGEGYGHASVEGIKGLALDKVFRATEGLPFAQKGPTVAAATYGIERATGASDEQAIHAALTNAGFTGIHPAIETIGRGVRALRGDGETVPAGASSQAETDTSQAATTPETQPQPHSAQATAPTGKVYEVKWADGRAVQYFDNLEAARKFHDDKLSSDDEPNAPRLVDTPKGARVKSDYTPEQEAIPTEAVEPHHSVQPRDESGQFRKITTKDLREAREQTREGAGEAAKEPWQMTRGEFDASAELFHGTGTDEARRIEREGFRVDPSRMRQSEGYDAPAVYLGDRDTAKAYSIQKGSAVTVGEENFHQIPKDELREGAVVPVRLREGTNVVDLKSQDIREGRETYAEAVARLRADGVDAVRFDEHGRKTVVVINPNAVVTHRSAVEAALREGKDVPSEVLTDYPDLQRPAHPKPVMEAARLGGDVAPNLSRNYRAGTNDATLTFASAEQRDLFDAGARLRARRSGSVYDTKNTDAQPLLESVAKRLNVSVAEARELAYKTHDDVKSQMKGVKHLEERKVVDNVNPVPSRLRDDAGATSSGGVEASSHERTLANFESGFREHFKLPERQAHNLTVIADELDKGLTKWGYKRGELIRGVAGIESGAGKGDALNQSAPKTPEFRRWFGKSKATNEAGEPIVVYHGTESDFDSFAPERRGTNTRFGARGAGYYFTALPDEASNYALGGKGISSPLEFLQKKYSEWQRRAGANVMPVYLKIENPANWRDVQEAQEFAHREIKHNSDHNQKSRRWDEIVVDYLKRKGFDGIIAPEASNEYVVFDPTQIKSATGNRGTFDPSDTNILRQQNRASIQFLKDGHAIIRALNDPNVSSGYHEFHHVFAPHFAKAIMRVKDANLKETGEAFFKWLGFRSATEFSRLHDGYVSGTLSPDAKARYVAGQEKGSRGFERYMKTGVAPNTKLRQVFAEAKEWLTNIYGAIRGKNHPLSGKLSPEAIKAWDTVLGEPKGEHGQTIHELYKQQREGVPAFFETPEVLRALNLPETASMDDARAALAEQNNVARSSLVSPRMLYRWAKAKGLSPETVSTIDSATLKALAKEPSEVAADSPEPLAPAEHLADNDPQFIENYYAGKTTDAEFIKRAEEAGLSRAEIRAAVADARDARKVASTKVSESVRESTVRSGRSEGRDGEGSDVASPFTVSKARYAKNSVAVRAKSEGDYKSRAQRLAEAVGGRWSNREHAYIMSESKARRLQKLHDDDYDANPYSGKLEPPKSAAQESPDVLYQSSNTRLGFREASPEERKSLRIPPAWTDVHISEDPDARLIAVGRDSKGRTQRIYSAAHTESQLIAKFIRQRDFNAKLPDILNRVESDIKQGRNVEEASVLRLIAQTGFRVGGEADTGGKVKAYGASTLRPEHVKIDGDTVHFDFTGKLGVRQEHSVTDAQLARDIEARIERGGPLFRTTDARVRNYLQRIAGDYKVHDFRTWNATDAARKAIEDRPAPKSPEEYWRERDEVGDIAARKIGDTRKIALETYVDPLVFEGWRESAGVKANDQRPRQARRKAGDVQTTTAANERPLRDEPLRPRPQAPRAEAARASQVESADVLYQSSESEALKRFRAATARARGESPAKTATEKPQTGPNERAATRLETSIADLERRISEADISTNRRTPKPVTEDVAALRAKRDALRNQLNALRRSMPPQGPKLSEGTGRPEGPRKNSSSIEVAAATVRAFILSNPATPIKAAIGLTTKRAYEQASKPLAAAFDTIFSKMTGANRATAGLSIGAISEGLKRAGREGVPDAWRILKGEEPQVPGQHNFPGIQTRVPAFDAAINTVQRVYGAKAALFYTDAFYNEVAGQAKLQAKREARTGKIPREQIEQRARQLIDNPSPEIQRIAVDVATRNVYMNENLFSDITKAGKSFLRRNIPGGHLAGTLAVPIDRVPSNAAVDLIFSVPVVGHAKAALQYAKAIENLREATRQTNPKAAEDLRHAARLAQNSASTTASKATMSTLFLLTGAYLAAKGDVDDKRARIPGTRLWANLATLGLPGLLTAMGGEIYRRTHAEGDKQEGIVGATAGSVKEALKEVPVIRGAVNAVDTSRRRGAGAGFSEAAANLLVPQAVQTASSLTDDRKRKPEGFLQSLEARIPFVRRYVPEDEGKPETNPHRLFDPFNISEWHRGGSSGGGRSATSRPASSRTSTGRTAKPRTTPNNR